MSAEEQIRKMLQEANEMAARAMEAKELSNDKKDDEDIADDREQEMMKLAQKLSFMVPTMTPHVMVGILALMYAGSALAWVQDVEESDFKLICEALYREFYIHRKKMKDD